MTEREPAARTAAAIIVAAGLASTAAACGGSQRSSSSPSNGALAFSRCMRSHGLAEFPDPNSSGAIPKLTLEQLGIGGARLQSAQSGCRRLLPNGGRPPDQAEQQLVRANALRFSQCVRSHGVTNFPDPDSTGRIPDPGAVGIDQGSPRFEAANQACRRYRPPYMPSNAAYRSWAKWHGGS